jgi:Zn-finger nucleic acid-binding protein
MHLTCPNCGGMTRTIERSSVADEHCANCQWIFVGRVELEALLAVKAQFERRDALEAVGAPLYEALASGADHHADHHADYHGLYRREYRTDGRDKRGLPSSRPYLRVVPPLPPDPPPAPLPDRDAGPVGLPRQHAGPESWFERPASRLAPARPLRRRRHRREWGPLEAFD